MKIKKLELRQPEARKCMHICTWAYTTHMFTSEPKTPWLSDRTVDTLSTIQENFCTTASNKVVTLFCNGNICSIWEIKKGVLWWICFVLQGLCAGELIPSLEVSRDGRTFQSRDMAESLQVIGSITLRRNQCRVQAVSGYWKLACDSSLILLSASLPSFHQELPAVLRGCQGVSPQDWDKAMPCCSRTMHQTEFFSLEIP